MPYLQLNDSQYPLRAGTVHVGASADAAIRLPGAEDPRARAILDVAPDQSTAIRRADANAVVRVNGVQLGMEPSPLLHGDRIELGAHTLLFADDRQAGSTQFVSSFATAPRPAGSARANRPTAATGGRLLSLMDGREYLVPPLGLVLGRDAGCDVVVPSSEVSRRHAEIAPAETGYVLRDTSTNGVWLNGTRVQGDAVLARGDVLRLGGEEFRFQADAASAAAPGLDEAVAAPAPELLLPPVLLPAPAPLVAPAPAAPDPGATLPPAIPSLPILAAADPATAAAPPSRGALATLQVVSKGLLEHRRLELRHPLANVGRGQHNDVVLADESVSDSHAKLQKRDGRWYVLDVSSTNGTYVAGRRLTAEEEIHPGAELRFGGVKCLFQPAGDVSAEGKGTRVIAGASLDQAKRAGAGAAERRAGPPRAAAPARGTPAWQWGVLVVVVVGAAAYFFSQGR